MEFIDINVSQEEINRHRYPPAVDEVKLGVEVGAQPKLSWRRITALGFGRPDEASTDDKVETAIAASLLVSASQPFSVLVESYDGNMAYPPSMTGVSQVPTGSFRAHLDSLKADKNPQPAVDVRY